MLMRFGFPKFERVGPMVVPKRVAAAYGQDNLG
jgi:hypothetical protein